MRFFDVKLHFTHTIKIKKLYKEGFTTLELALMYRVPEYVINKYTQGLKQVESV